ncbi:hypothetical protein OQA88_13480 [Cercophora sp. LCS_1]
MATPFTIPTIDLSGYLSGDPVPTAYVVTAVRSAAISSGFFHITGHGISAPQSERLLDAIRRFFALPQEIKDTLRQDQAVSFRGYEPSGSQHLENKVPDLQEGFICGSAKSPTIGHIVTRGPNK